MPNLSPEEERLLAMLRGEQPVQLAASTGVNSLIDRMRGLPSSDEFVASERAHLRRGEAEAATIAEAKKQDLSRLWQEDLSNANGDVNVAIKQWIRRPEFFLAGDGSPGGYTKLIREALASPLDPQGAIEGQIAQGRVPSAMGPAAAVAPGEAARLIAAGQAGIAYPKPEAAKETTIDKELAKKSVASLDKVVEAGHAAELDKFALDRLATLGPKIGTGAGAYVRGHLARVGIKLPGSSDIEAFEALVDRLTPAQRQGLPGAASDRDVAMFRGSLPSLIRTPEGNQAIVRTLAAMAEDKIKRANIAEQVFTGDLSVPQALRKMRDLPNPMARFQASSEAKAQESGKASDATPTLPEVGEIRPGRGGVQFRYVGPNPHDQRSWERVQ